MNILLIEDDLELGNATRIALADRGYRVTWVRRLSEAMARLIDGRQDVVLLDLGLPDGDGMQLLGRIGQTQPLVPVMVLTARDRLQDRLAGLDGGADDFLVKPFDLAELVSRVRALARRAYGLQANKLELRGLCIHLGSQRVSVDGRAVELSRSEYMLLCTLLTRADRVQTRRALEEEMGSSVCGRDSNVLDVQISSLRKKLGEGYIRTVRGVGYVMERDCPAVARS